MASLPDIASSQEGVLGPHLPPGPDLDILIVGKTGHGKSATANSIFGEECFLSEGSTASVTDAVGVFQKEMDGRKLLVVDTPGLSDTGIHDAEQARKKAEHDFSLAISLSPDGFHVILLVFRYGQRMTKEEVDAVKQMKALLGQNFIKDHGIMLFTYGDNFKRNMKGSKSFKTWCEEQKGFMQEVLHECQNRCLIFDNEGDEDVLKQQRFELVQMIDGMTSGKRFDGGIFETIKDKWRTDGDPVTRNAYLQSSTIFFGMTSLVRRTKQYDQKFVDEMRHKLEQLKVATKDLKGAPKKIIDRKIVDAEVKLNQVEKKIQASDHGYITESDSFAQSVLVAILEIIRSILVIILQTLFAALALIVLAVIRVFEAVWEGLKSIGVAVIKGCVLQ